MSETADADDWRDLAAQIHEQGGVAERRAEAVALIATGHSHEEARDAMGYSSSGSISNHIERYRDEDIPEAEWLLENGPEL